MPAEPATPDNNTACVHSNADSFLHAVVDGTTGWRGCGPGSSSRRRTAGSRAAAHATIAQGNELCRAAATRRSRSGHHGRFGRR